MTDAVSPGLPDAHPTTKGRSPLSHLRWLVVIGIVATGLVVFSVVQTLHYSNSVSQPKLGEAETPGFLTPKSAKPAAFSLPRLSGLGREVTMASELGRPLVLNLWATTCTVCVSETPAIESVARKAGTSVEFVGVDTLDERGPAQAFVRRFHVTYQELFDPTGKVASSYGVPGLPVTFFVTPAGKVVGENLGALTAQSLEYHLKTLFGVTIG